MDIQALLAYVPPEAWAGLVASLFSAFGISVVALARRGNVSVQRVSVDTEKEQLEAESMSVVLDLARQEYAKRQEVETKLFQALQEQTTYETTLVKGRAEADRHIERNLALQERIGTLERSLSKLEKRIEVLQLDVDRAVARYGKAEQELQIITIELEQAVTREGELQQQLANEVDIAKGLRTQLAAAHEKIAELEVQKHILQEKINNA